MASLDRRTARHSEEDTGALVELLDSPEAGPVELYDLRTDSGETSNVASRFADVRAELVEALREWQASTERLELEPVEMTPEGLEALRALGYVQ